MRKCFAKLDAYIEYYSTHISPTMVVLVGEDVSGVFSREPTAVTANFSVLVREDTRYIISGQGQRPVESGEYQCGLARRPDLVFSLPIVAKVTNGKVTKLLSNRSAKTFQVSHCGGYGTRQERA